MTLALMVTPLAGGRSARVEFFREEKTVKLATVACGLGFTATGRGLAVDADPATLESLATELDERGSSLGLELRRYLRPVPSWRLRDGALALDTFHVMGIINLTVDSFSGDGVGDDLSAAVAKADELRDAGACIIDVGGESARAGRPVVAPDEEAATVTPVVEALTAEGHRVSIDTYKPAVATAALEAGAVIVNDISGLTVGPGAAEAAAAAGAAYVLNYSFSPPKRRPDSPPVYQDVVAETVGWFHERLKRLEAAGLARESIAIDPGIAFGKSHDEDIQMLRGVGSFKTFGQPLLLAHSRKNFIGSISGRDPGQRDLETHVLSALALSQGVQIFRVHDVAGARRALLVAEAVTNGEAGDYAPDEESWPWRGGAFAGHATGAETLESAPPGQRW